MGKLWLETHLADSSICQFVHTYTHNSITKGRIRTLYLMNHCSVTERSIFRVRTVCTIQWASVESRHTSQPLSNATFVCAHTHISKTTSHRRMFYTSNDCSTIVDIPCVVDSCKRDSTGELLPQTCIGCSLI